MEIIYHDINELKPYKKNPRINNNAIQYVAESIKKFGFKVPIVIDKNLEIVSGHTRLEASKLIGLTSIPCIVADDLSKEQIKAFRLIDNKTSEYALWDYDKLDAELKKLNNEEMKLLGFFGDEGIINWDAIDEINENNYEEPEHDIWQCPFCKHTDKKLYFKKTSE